jgi:hypothetical protein
MIVLGTGFVSYTHHYDRDGRLVSCSEVEQWTDETGARLGWGNCPHDVDADGLPLVVEAPLRLVEG